MIYYLYGMLTVVAAILLMWVAGFLYEVWQNNWSFRRGFNETEFMFWWTVGKGFVALMIIGFLIFLGLIIGDAYVITFGQ
jgi:hypothetical protein